MYSKWSIWFISQSRESTLKQSCSQMTSFLQELRIYLYNTLKQVSYIVTTETGSYVMSFSFLKYEPRQIFFPIRYSCLLLSSPGCYPRRLSTLAGPFISCRGYSVLVVGGGEDVFSMLNLYSDEILETLYTDEVRLVLGNTSSFSCVLR